MTFRRPWVRAFLCVGMVVVPLVALQGLGNGAQTVTAREATAVDLSAQLASRQVVAKAAPDGDYVNAPDAEPSSDVVVAAVAPNPVPALLPLPPRSGLKLPYGPVLVPVVTTKLIPAAKRVVAAPLPTTPAVPAGLAPAAPPGASALTAFQGAASHGESGDASWYGAPAGTCAHKSLPFGTLITVTDLDNGRVVQCRIYDRGPYLAGRILDLSPDVFSRLAPTSLGVIEVRATW